MKEKFKYLLVFFITIILLPISVLAKESVELKIDKTDLKIGDELKVTASVPNKMEAYAIMATLKYDKNVFQVVNDSNFTIKNDESIKYSKETNKFGIINKTGKISLNDGDILFTVNLKVKDDANVGNTNIALTNITYTDGKNVQNLDTTSLKILVTKDAEDGEIVSANKENEIVEDEENIIKTYNSIPLIIFLGVLVLVGLITILIINNKNKDNNDEKKKKTIFILIALEIILAITTIIILWLNLNKTDVNNDGKKDYHDAEEIIDYLINIESSKETKKENNKTNNNSKKPTNKYDVNNDGKIDIEDVGNTTEQIEDNTKLTLKELKEDNEYYVEKGKITLKFTADITPKEAKITKVKIDNKYYNVELVSGVYIAIIENTEAGVHNFVIEEVTLSNGVKRKTNLKITKEVLKDRPVVDDLSHDIRTSELSFTLKDKDKALQSAMITIFEGNITEEDIKNSAIQANPDDFDDFKVVFEEELDIAKNSFTFKPKLDVGGIYTIVITGKYDLDSKIGDNNNYEEQFLNNGLNVITVGKITITPKSTEEIFLTKSQTHDYLFDVDFEPQIIAQDVKQVLIGEQYVDVTYEDGHLKLVLDDSKVAGAKNIVISAVKLEDGTDVLCHYEISYDVLKDEPTIENFVYHKKTNQITFTLKDNDNAIKDANIKITNKDNEEVFAENLSLDTKDYTYNNINLEEGDTYSINIVGNYDLDSDINNDANDGIAKYEHNLTIYNVELQNANEEDVYYTEKGEEITLKFKAKINPTNEDAKISQVTIDDGVYEPQKDENGIYSVTITAPNKAEEKKYTIRNVIMDDEYIDESLSLKVDVLKDVPTIEDLLIDESKDIPVISFTIKDPDDALDKNAIGNLVIAKDGGKTETIAIDKDFKEIALDAFADELAGSTFNLDIKVNYSRHNCENASKYKEVDKKLIDTKQFKIYTATLTPEDNNNFVTKNEIVEFKLKSEIKPIDGSTIKSFVLENNKVVDANKINDELYAINLETLNVAGDKTYKIEKIILENDIEIKATANISVYVLKDIPYVNKLNLNEDNESISYELHDPDNALTSGTITITGKGDQALTKNVQKSGKDTIDYNFQDGESYVVEVIGSYDLDSNKENNQNSVDNKQMSLESFIVGGEYNFTLTNASITDALKPNEYPILTFKSTNTRNTFINRAELTIDGKSNQYEVTKTDKDTYQIDLSNVDINLGKHTVTLDRVSMNNGAKTFENTKDYKVNELTYTVLKEAPKVDNLTLNVNKANKSVVANFSLIDPNNALKKLNVALVDSTGKIVSTKVLNYDEFASKDKINVELSYNGNTDGRYTVKVLADYELAQKYFYANECIGENTVLVYSNDEIRIDRMYVVNDRNVEQVDGLFPTKLQKNYQIALEVTIADSVKARGYGRVSGVTINGVNYPANQISGYKSKVYINVPATAGVLELTANRVQLANDGYYRIYNDYYSVPETTLKLDVLKDKPKIENLEIEENYEKKEVTFNFDVVLDDTAKSDEFTDGTITLNGVDKDIKVGPNKVTFTNVEQDKTYDLIFKGTYDLDTNTIDGINEDKNKTVKGEFYRVKYGLYNDNTYETINITDAKLVSEKGNKYFEKNEKIKLQFKVEGLNENLGVLPSKVVIKDKEYNLTKLDDNYYELVIDGYSSFGEKAITITDIILDNSKKVNLNRQFTFNPEVLKDAIKINDYKYKVDDDEITINIDLDDSDNAIVGFANIIVTDEKGEELYNIPYQNGIVIKREDKSILRYYVKLTLDYDRDIDKGDDTANHYSDVLLLDELISLEKNNIELKDIIDINLYKYANDEESIKKIDEISIAELKDNLDSYFVEVVMEKLPAIRTKIVDVKTVQNHLILVLDFEYVTKEGGTKNNLEVDFGEIKENNKAKNEFHPETAIESLIAKLEANEPVTLNQNYDFSKIKLDRNVYIENYSGVLNGNGYTFKNLSKPLFGTLTGEVKNLNINDVTFDGNGHGALANNTNGAKIEYVLVDRVTRTSTGNNPNGGLIGVADNTQIKTSRVTNVLINAGYYEQQNGLFIGNSNSNTIVENCYAEGTISGGYNYTSGFIGNAKSTTMRNNYAKVTTRSQSGSVFGFASAYSNNASIYENNVSIASGTSTTMISNARTINNNYFFINKEVSDSSGITVIKEDEIDDNLFANRVGLNKDIWYIKDVNINNLPIFQIEKKSVINDKTIEDYQEEHETLYKNLMQLMPFFDDKKIVETSKNIPEDSKLITKTIKHIVPVDENGNLVTYLTTDNPKKIKNIKIIFTDGEKEEYKVNYDKTYDMVASYKISGLNIDYNYEHYIINNDSQVVVNLTNYLKGLDYTNNLDILTTNADSRLYRDFYNENTKYDLEEFVLKYLSNSEYTNTSSNRAINNYIESEVKKGQKLEKALYVYNYLKRFYDLDIDGMKLYDFIMFDMKGFDESLTTDKIVELYLGNGSGENFETNNTNKRYNEVLGKYTNLNTIPKLVEYLVKGLTNDDLSAWTRSQVKSILVEIPIDGHPNVKYTLWDHFISESNDEILNQFLPMLTLPEGAAYIMSMPVQYIIGAQRTYIVDPTNPSEVANLKARMKTYETRMKRYFATAYSILEDEKLFNDILIYSVDKRLTKTETGSVSNTAYTTTEPFHKNFVEATGLWAAAAGVNAAAWGPRLEWQVAGILDSTLADEGYNDTSHVTFRTWSHESAHLIDARLFLRNNGRRFDAGGEDYADNFLMQSFDRNSITMNLSMMMDKTANSVEESKEAKLGPVASNLTPERINSPEKIHDFYRKLFETVYVMDYIEAQAFLKLPLETQKLLGIQVSYPNETKQFTIVLDEKGNDTEQLEGPFYKDDEFAKFRARQTTRYTRLNEVEDFNTPLRTMNDLINNRIMLYSGINKFASRGSNSYGGEGINTVHWYQPWNPDGRPDSYSLKWISYEMLGWKGYNNGFVEYASNVHYQANKIYSDLSHPKNGTSTVNYKSDSMALAQISNNRFSNFSDYKKYRFNEIKDKLDRLDSEIKVDEYIDEFYDALNKDAVDISNGILNYQYSTAVRHKIYYTLKTKTKDFRDEIFKDSTQQTITKLAE